MGKDKAILAAFTLLLATTVSAVGPATYDGNLQVNLQDSDQTFSAGEKINADLTVSNSDNRPIVDGYVVVNIVQGEDPYYPSQKSNNDTVFHQEKIEDIYIKAGNSRELSYSYELPDNLESGNYRIEAYFKTSRTPVVGLPFIYSTPVHKNFEVSGSGNFPVLDISRTQTVFTGVDESVGDWVPNSTNFKETKWPSLTGPVGVLTTPQMENVDGEIVIQNEGSNSRTATVDITVCEWDDTACSNRVDTVSKTVSVSPGTERVPVQVQNPEDPGAYAVKIEVSSDGQTQSIYRNRIIRQGNTTRVRKLSVNQPYVRSGNELSVGLVAGASPDHYTDPSALGVKAKVTVETLDGEQVMQKTKTIPRLSNTNVFEQLYFNKTVDQTLSEYRVSGTLSADGETFDTYSYEVDYSKFQNDLENLELSDYSFEENTLEVELCGRTDEGIPTTGEVQTILMNNGTVSSMKTQVIDQCETVTFEEASSDSYELVANYNTQERFNITRAAEEGPGGTGEDEGLPVLPIAAGVLALLVIAAVLYFRGDNQ